MELSIIIPVYNLEKYIEACLKSCLMQDIDDYEVLCIDDGSKDGSVKILDDYATRYVGKITVFHKENGGVSSARNEGIKRAAGKWVWFVDGDDCIKPNCLGSLLKTLNEHPCDIMAIQNTMFCEDMRFEDIMNICAADKNEDNIECIAFKIFKTEIIKKYDIVFDETLSHGEDNIFIYKFMKKINTYHIDNKVVYYYRKRMTSASRSKQTENKRKLYKSQIWQALFYHSEQKEYDESYFFAFSEIKYRKELFLKRALMTMCMFETDKDEVRRVLKSLKAEGLYPAMFGGKVSGSFKEKIYKFIQNHLGKEAFFMMMWRMNRLLQKGRD